MVLRVEHYVPAPLRCFKCAKYRHHREAFRGRQTCAKCVEKDPDHVEEDCLKEIRCANCQDHLGLQNSPTASLQRGKTPNNKCPGYDTKQSDGEVPAMLEIWQ